MQYMGDRAVGWIHNSKSVCSIQTCWCCLWPCEYVCMWCPEFMILWIRVDTWLHITPMIQFTASHFDLLLCIVQMMQIQCFTYSYTHKCTHTHPCTSTGFSFCDSVMVGANDGILQKTFLLFLQDMSCNSRQPSCGNGEVERLRPLCQIGFG